MSNAQPQTDQVRRIDLWYSQNDRSYAQDYQDPDARLDDASLALPTLETPHSSVRQDQLSLILNRHLTNARWGFSLKLSLDAVRNLSRAVEHWTTLGAQVLQRNWQACPLQVRIQYETYQLLVRDRELYPGVPYLIETLLVRSPKLGRMLDSGTARTRILKFDHNRPDDSVVIGFDWDHPALGGWTRFEFTNRNVLPLRK